MDDGELTSDDAEINLAKKGARQTVVNGKPARLRSAISSDKRGRLFRTAVRTTHRAARRMGVGGAGRGSARFQTIGCSKAAGLPFTTVWRAPFWQVDLASSEVVRRRP